MILVYSENRQMIRSIISAIALIIACLSGTLPAAHARTCTTEDFGAAVDRSGQNIRDLSQETQPKIRKLMARYAKANSITQPNFEEQVFEKLYDEKIAALDKKSSQLLIKIDRMGRGENKKLADCARLDEINQLSAELMNVMRTKSRYVISRLEQKLQKQDDETVAAKSSKQKKSPAKPSGVEHADKAKSKKQPAEKKWAPQTKHNDAYVPPRNPTENGRQAATSPGDDGLPGYSIDEIRAATKGFFGTVSTSLASVIEHAFKTSGRPTAYVLGTEGGGAFMAGVRYGKGRLFMRDTPGYFDIYWHGPSVGTDFGASGSRTMFLIYAMKEPSQIYRAFTGLDGSAYFVGGVGLTLMKGGKIVLAPIRSGLGLRLGANIGYLRFTAEPTWNPF